MKADTELSIIDCLYSVSIYIERERVCDDDDDDDDDYDDDDGDDDDDDDEDYDDDDSDDDDEYIYKNCIDNVFHTKLKI